MHMHAHGRPEQRRPSEVSGRRHGDAAVGGVRAARPPATPAEHLSPDMLLMLQRAIGNDAVARLVAGRNDHDPAAESDHQVQRSAVHEVLRSSGRPLDEPTRTEMEARFGADFSDVRLHSDGTARDSAAQIGARAYTSGSHVVIGAGGGDWQTLAHELAHVVQQRSGPVAGTDNGSGLSVSDPADRFEREAEQTASRVMSQPPREPGRVPPGGPEPGSPRAPVVQRAALTELSGAQRSLRDLASRWKAQSFFALTTGRSNELQAVDSALADWRAALDAGNSSLPLLREIHEAIANWRAAKADTGSRSYRAVHIDSLDARVVQAMGDRVSGIAEALGDRWRVSTNGGMVVERGEPQNFFALPSVIGNANAALGQQGSTLRLEPSAGPVPAELGPLGLQRVAPVIVAGGRASGEGLLSVHECIDVAKKVTGRDMDLAILAPDQQGGGRVTGELDPHDQKSLSALPHRVTQPGMTSGRLLRDLTADKVLFTWQGHLIKLDLDDYDGTINRQAFTALDPALRAAGMDIGMARLLLRAFRSHNLEEHPALQQILVDRLGALLANPPAPDAENTIKIAASALGVERHDGYEDNPDPARDSRLGINEATSPEVGEAYAIYSTRERTRDQWNFHFAGVVARDGDDTVTLENYTRTVKSKEGTEEAKKEEQMLSNPAKLWYFDLQGPGRSFHGKYRESVAGAITLTMSGAPKPGTGTG
jgi:hypothetical protein